MVFYVPRDAGFGIWLTLLGRVSQDQSLQGRRLPLSGSTGVLVLVPTGSVPGQPGWVSLDAPPVVLVVVLVSCHGFTRVNARDVWGKRRHSRALLD